MAPTSVPDTASELARLEALRRYAILDTSAEREFDELVQRAAQECGYPAALISLMDANRCWFKATTGLQPGDRYLCELPRDQTFCNYAFRSSGVFIVPDARNDERFRQLRVVDRPNGYRAYVGVQLITPEGHSIGSLCLLDTAPHTPTAAQLEKLRALATRVMALIESRQHDRASGSSAQAGSTAHAAPPGVASAARNLVMIVDDEELIRGLAAAMVTRLGCETRVAANGLEALECIAALDGRVRLVITDIHMPVMNGVELARALRAQPGAPAVVAMSGRFTPESRAALHSEGVSHLIAKPFGIAELDGALKAALPGRR